MSGAFASSAFATSAFSTDAVVVSSTYGSGGSRRGRRREELTYEDWAKFAEWRDALYASRDKAPAKTVRAIQQAVELVDVPPDVYVAPRIGETARAVAEGLANLVNYLRREDEDEESSVEMLLLH